MNVYAYHPSDKTKTLTHIDEWVVKYGIRTNGHCRVCHTEVHVKAATSQKQTHFSHYSGSACPSVSDNRKPYEIFSNLPRDKQGAEEAKAWLRENITEVYEKLRREFRDLNLLWNDFFELVENANKLDIWSLKGMPHCYIPYVLLMCIEKFEKRNNRPRTSYFVLEPSPTGMSYWNESGFYKRAIWEITLPSRDVKKQDVDIALGTPWYINKINILLK